MIAAADCKTSECLHAGRTLAWVYLATLLVVWLLILALKRWPK